MYPPSHFVVDDINPLLALIRLNSFATLISSDNDQTQISHLPLILGGDEADPYLLGHMAKANPLWKQFDGNTTVTVMFQGPHAYISPRWYQSAENVPTWNYTAVHITGTPRCIDNPEKTRSVLTQMASYFEQDAEQPWSLDTPPADYIKRMLRGIVAFEIPIEHMEGIFKISQNKSEDDQAGAIKGLRETDDPNAHRLAQLMSLML